jgi:uncharacterized protein with FMN-binding domain
MKRFLLIAAGTVGGLGAVLSVTPPQLGAADLGLGLDMGTLTTPDATVSTPAAANNKPAVSTPTKKSTKPQSTQTASSAPAPVQAPATTPAAPATNSINGTFSGPVVDVSYGNVQVQITVTNGKITDAQALIAPTGKNDKYTKKALPGLKQQTLAAQSTNIQGVSGASYTTYGWRKSLQGAMVKAGL